MYLTCGPGSAQFRDFMTIFKNLSSLHPCGVCLSVAPPAHLLLQCWRSQGSVFVLVQSLCFFFFPNWQNIMFFISGFWAAHLIEIMHQIAQRRPKTFSGQGSCFCFMATLWDNCNVNHDGINRSTHPDEHYCSVNSCTNHALHSPAVSTGKGIWMLVMLYL